MNYLQKLSILNIRKQWKFNFYVTKRLLFNPADLGIDSFIQKKHRIQNANLINWNVHKQKLKETCDQEDNTMIFSNDVTKMIYNAENEEDLELLHKLLKKIKTQKFVKAGSYYYGVEVMRLYYILNKPMKALRLVQDESLYSEFESPSSFIIFLELLFKNKHYKEVVEMYNYRTKHSNFSYFNPLHLIYFAACYKLNNNDSLQNAIKVWQKLSKIQYKAGVRARLFISALSLNQNQLFCAMEILPNSYFDAVCENLKCIILAKSKRYGDALENLKTILECQKDDIYVLKETIDELEKVISNSKEHMKEFQCIKEGLIEKNKIKDGTIDALLCAEVEIKNPKTTKDPPQINTVKNLSANVQ